MPEKKRMICSDFEKWALELNDIDGGNPKANIWLCGIEPGGKLPTELEYNRSRSDNNDIPYWNAGFRETLRKENLNKWYFERRVVKLLIELGKIQAPSINDYIQNELYDKKGLCFKLNLYPLNCQRFHVWTRDHARLSNFKDKNSYYQWCRSYRYKQLTALIQQYRPPVLICTGKIFWDEFISAFDINNKDIKLDFSKNIISLPNNPLILTRHFNNIFAKDQNGIAQAIKRKFKDEGFGDGV